MSRPRLNLLPQDLRPRLRISREAGVLAFFGLALVYVAAAAFLVQTGISATQVQLSGIEARNRQLASELTVQGEQAQLESQAVQKVQSLREIVQRRIPWSDVFKELSFLVPEKVWLSEMATSTEASAMQVILRGEGGSQKAIADFYSALEQSVFFGQVQIRYSEKVVDSRPDLYKFEFSVPLARHRGVK